MNKHPYRLLIISFILGFIFDFLFWKHQPGVNFPIFTILILIGGLVLLITSGHNPSKWSLITILPITFFSIMTCIRKEPLTIFMSFLFTFLYLAIFAVTYEGGRWYKYILPDYFVKLSYLVASIFRPPHHVFRSLK